MLRTPFIITQLIKITILAIPAGFEYYSTRNMGVYRYLIAFNYRQQQWLTPLLLNWLGAAFIILVCVFIWRLMRGKRPALARLGILWSIAMVGLIGLVKAQALITCYLWLYAGAIALLISIIGRSLHPRKSPPNGGPL